MLVKGKNKTFKDFRGIWPGGGGGKGGDKLLGINAFRIITSWLALCTDHPWC